MAVILICIIAHIGPKYTQSYANLALNMACVKILLALLRLK